MLLKAKGAKGVAKLAGAASRRPEPDRADSHGAPDLIRHSGGGGTCPTGVQTVTHVAVTFWTRAAYQRGTDAGFTAGPSKTSLAYVRKRSINLLPLLSVSLPKQR